MLWSLLKSFKLRYEFCVDVKIDFIDAAVGNNFSLFFFFKYQYIWAVVIKRFHLNEEWVNILKSVDIINTIKGCVEVIGGLKKRRRNQMPNPFRVLWIEIEKKNLFLYSMYYNGYMGSIPYKMW